MNARTLAGDRGSPLADWVRSKAPTWPPSTLPAFEFPAPLARLFERLPQLPPTMALVAALNLALGRVLPRESLEPVVGKTILIRVLDAGLTLSFSLTPPASDLPRPAFPTTCASRRARATSSRSRSGRKIPTRCSSTGAC